MKPAVTVVMPAYNAENTIISAVFSVIDQTSQDWEMVIVDDCSSDMTPEIVRQLCRQDSRIRGVFNETNIGAGKSREVGVAKANGDFIALLDADDLWLPRKLERCLEFINEKDAYWCHTAARPFNGSKNIGPTIRSRTLRKSLERTVLNPILLSTAIVRRDLYPTGKNFELAIAHDLEMWAEVQGFGFPCLYVDEVLTLYRLTPKSLSRNVWVAALDRYRWLKGIHRHGRLEAYFFAYVVLVSLRRLRRLFPGCEVTSFSQLIDSLESEASSASLRFRGGRP